MSFCSACGSRCTENDCLCRKCVRDCRCVGEPYTAKKECKDYYDLFDYLESEDDANVGD